MSRTAASEVARRNGCAGFALNKKCGGSQLQLSPTQVRNGISPAPHHPFQWGDAPSSTTEDRGHIPHAADNSRLICTVTSTSPSPSAKKSKTFERKAKGGKRAFRNPGRRLNETAF